jgi:hypothetical protein
MKTRARVMRKLIGPLNWHRDGCCRFPVLCMYDDMLIWELDGIDSRRATWRRARAARRQMDQMVSGSIRKT